MFVKILMHLKNALYSYGGVGEVVNTLVCGTSMQGFDSLTPPHLKLTYETIKFVSFILYNLLKVELKKGKRRIKIFYVIIYNLLA